MTGVWAFKLKTSELAWRPIVVPVVLIFTAVVFAFRLGSSPAVWFDEGWVFTVARNWLQRGEYVLLLNGSPAAPDMLNVGFPAIAPVVLSFRLFGIGVWQGRLPFVLFTLGAMWLTCLLADRLLRPKAGLFVLFAVLFMCGGLSPILPGREALGEFPAVFFALLGYLALTRAADRPHFAVPVVSVAWALATATKVQALPFLVAAIAVTGFRLHLSGTRHFARIYMWIGLGWLIAFCTIVTLDRMVLGDNLLHHLTPGVLSLAGVVLSLSARATAGRFLLAFGVPALLGLVHEVRHEIEDGGYRRPLAWLESVRFHLWVLGVGWLAWYALLSPGWDRYLVPSVFLVSIFVADMLAGWTGGVDLRRTIQEAHSSFLRSGTVRHSLGALAVVLLSGWLAIGALQGIVDSLRHPDSSATRVAEYINQMAPAESLVETANSELLFLLERPYRYPPIDVYLRAFGPRKPVNTETDRKYDVLQTGADYLIIATNHSLRRLYTEALVPGEFRLLKTIGKYSVYERVQNPLD